MANTFIKNYGKNLDIKFIDMQDSMKDKYQSCTCADISKLKNAGIDYKFTPLEEGVEKYVKWLKENSKCQKIQN